ncbi:hypothetical protein KQ945_01370 [Bacillus subtilis subsp. subtilis]|nr:hypothetical protein [Bacillus subtilis subsp. subtilis]
MDNGRENTDDASTTRWGWIATALAGVLTVLMLTPFNPVMPIAGVDGSWAYAMNVATAEHLRFGKDIIFTFGPWASVYTRAYHPATDGLMMGGSLLMAVAFFMGLLATVVPRRRPLLLLAPLVLALMWSPWWNGWRDAVLLLVPLLLPFVVMRGLERGRPFVVTVCMLAAASAMLPLVKGNISLMVAVATLIALALSWRSSPRIAITIIVVQLLAITAAWSIAGQQLVDLPGYFLAQAPIISGYTDAMSVGGRWFGLAVFTVMGAGLLGIAALCGRRRHWYIPVLVAVYLFITFKSGFVRQDEHHALVSAAALAWVGLVLLIGPRSGDGRGVVAFAGGLLGWGLITSACVSLAPDASMVRLAEAVYTPVQGAWWRLTQPEALPTKFHKQVELIGSRPPFAGYTGAADVYPWDLAPLLAAGADWKPRPILQSYSAFTPALVSANAAHLARNPPARVYFNTYPIDNRYPSTEDGASWLSLLGSYTPVKLDGDYAVLARTDPARPALVPNAPVKVNAVLGQEFAVVGWDRPVWVTMDIRPTVAGRVFSILFKAPKLSLRVRYEDNTTADFRLIAGMVKTGFLLSPTVVDASDFIALGSSHRQDLLGKRKVVAIGVVGESGTRFLWNLDYAVTFAGLDIPVSAAADAALAGPWKQSAVPADYPAGGDCNIDDVDGRPATTAAMDVADGTVMIRGWAAIDGRKGMPNRETALLVTGRDLATYRLPTHRVPRPDVAGHFKQSALEYAGFEAYVDVRRLPPDAQVRVVQRDGTRDLLCSPVMLTLHRSTDAGGAIR